MEQRRPRSPGGGHCGQGGDVALAVGGLLPNVTVVPPDVPLLCHFRRATEITGTAAYAEIARCCQVRRDKVEAVFNTLSYFAGLNFSARCNGRALFSVGPVDEHSPPSAAFAAYNHFTGPKGIRIWHYNRHEGGVSHQTLERVRFLESLWLWP